jgi:glycosyltransferase involved in cell wall biosynthesis
MSIVKQITNKMIIGIDGNEANVKNRVGVNTYAYELLKKFIKLQVISKTSHEFIVYLKDKPLDDMPEETANFKYRVLPGRGLWVITKLVPYLLVNADRLDVFFTPSHYLPILTTIPQVCSIMDLGYLEYTDQFTKKVFWQLKWWSAMSIFVSKAVVAISQSTKKDIVRHYPSASSKVHVTPLAYDADKFNINIQPNDVRRVKNKYSIVDDYILYLGTLKPSKNLERLVEAFGTISAKYQTQSNYQLVIAGKKGWMFDSIFKKVKDLGLEKKVIFTDFIPETDKPGLIRGAKVFALPSLWEGFGLDVLNALSCGVPVVVSNVGSLPEVVGDAGTLIDPNSVDSIAQGISKVLSMDKNDYNSMVSKGLAQVKKFSWERTASETLAIIENVNRQNR